MLSVFLAREGRVTNHVFLEIQNKVCETTYFGGRGRGLQEEIYLLSSQNFNVGKGRKNRVQVSNYYHLHEALFSSV